MSQTAQARSPSEDDLEVSPPLGDSRFMLEPINATYVEEWESSTKGMRYAVPTAVGAQGGKAVEAWLAIARKNRKGESLTRKKPQWTGEERSRVPITPEFRALTAKLVAHFGGFHAAERGIEANIARLPAGRHRARYRVTRKQLERICGKSSRRFAEWRTLDALASIAPQIGTGTFNDWVNAIQPAFISLGLGLYRTWCIHKSPGQLLLPLPAPARLLIRKFEKRWLQAGHESRRVALAVRRSLEPLLLGYQAGAGIECDFDDLLADGPFLVTDFVEHGLKREDILLRAQKGTGRDRAEKQYGGPSGQNRWRAAAGATRKEAEREIEDLQLVIKYLDFVETRHTDLT